MKTLSIFFMFALLISSCQNQDDQNQEPPNYSLQYVGSWAVHLSIADVTGFNSGFQVPDHADVTVTITADPIVPNLIWVSGFYGTAQSIPATASSSGFTFNSSNTGVHPSDIGFAKLNGQVNPYFDDLTISGTYTYHGTVSYALSDNGIDLDGCSGTIPM